MSLQPKSERLSHRMNRLPPPSELSCLQPGIPGKRL